MKRVVLLMMLFFVSMSVSAQEHLSFMGIPIDGTPSTFGQKLIDKGFKFSHEYDGVKLYEGEFAGYYDCDVAIKYVNNMVYEVVVLFPESSSWGHLYSTYSSLKDMLTTKYGERVDGEEEFVDTPSYIDLDEDNDRFYEVKDGHCNYYSFFALSNGFIQLEIKSSINPVVGIHYVDLRNSAAKTSAALDDL